MRVRCPNALLGAVLTLVALGVAPLAGQELETPKNPSVVASLQTGQSINSVGDVGVDWEAYGSRVELFALPPFAPFAQVEYASRGISCPDAVGVSCPRNGWATSIGGNIRPSEIGPDFLRPYLGAGLGIFRWSDGDSDAIAEGHIGADWMLDDIGLRSETGLNESGWFLGFGLVARW